jgi:hypothetical protein
MKLFICRNCFADKPSESGSPVPGYKFYADLPVCPKCTADQRNPRHMHYIAECEVIHFDPPDPVLRDRGTNVAACDPSIKIGGLQEGETVKPNFGTGHRSVVNCPKCMESEAFLLGKETEGTLKAK